MTRSIGMPASTPAERIAKALAIAVETGGSDGAHHKDWTIDQMVRALTGCPLVEVISKDHRGKPFAYMKQGESSDYLQLVSDACGGDDGANNSCWDVGIPP